MFLIDQTQKNKYIFFIENLLIKLKNDQLTNEEFKEISEFYMNYMFIRENIDDDEKLKKYMSLGWYIYEILNDNKS